MRRDTSAALMATLAGVAMTACAAAAPERAVGDRAGMPPLATVVYRGVPSLDDLAAIRAYDFPAVSWSGPADAAAGVREDAARLGLAVLLAADEPPITPEAALDPAPAVTIAVDSPDAGIVALAWRAIAHGARQVTFDAGRPWGAGFTEEDGRPRPWVTKARSVARQMTFNHQLITSSRPGPAVSFDGDRPSGLDVVLLETDQVWILVATNTADVTARAAVRLPALVPSALWVDVLDGTEMSMLNEPDGPRWTFELAPDGARFYAIDKDPGQRAQDVSSP